MTIWGFFVRWVICVLIRLVMAIQLTNIFRKIDLQLLYWVVARYPTLR